MAQPICLVERGPSQTVIPHVWVCGHHCSNHPGQGLPKATLLHGHHDTPRKCSLYFKKRTFITYFFPH